MQRKAILGLIVATLLFTSAQAGLRSLFPDAPPLNDPPHTNKPADPIVDFARLCNSRAYLAETVMEQRQSGETKESLVDFAKQLPSQFSSATNPPASAVDRTQREFLNYISMAYAIPIASSQMKKDVAVQDFKALVIAMCVAENYK